MNKLARVAAIAVMAGVALTGCASTTGTLTWTGSHPSTVQNPSKTDVVVEVQDNWVGRDVPTPEWITTAATLVCKRDIAGIEPRVVTRGWQAAKNDTVMVDAARKFVCA
jgi:hypothetical protein